MFRQLVRRWQTARDDAAVRRRAINDGLWRRTLIRYPFLQRQVDADAAELRRLTSLFLDRKEFSAGPGVRLGNDVVVAIAAQACLPILKLGLDAYKGFVGIVLHADQVLANRSVVDDDGIVHEYEEALTGEAVDGGPIMLSWRDVRSAGRSAADGYNVVIHEFAHVLDMAHSLSHGLPCAATGCAGPAWAKTLQDEYATFVARIEADEPVSLDPYGAESISEYFAVATEAFFVSPEVLLQEHPALYDRLQGYFRQDPLQEAATRARRPGLRARPAG